MDEEYDAIVLGTGLKECILSGLMSVRGYRVLHIDRNAYYGGETASLTPLTELYKFFGDTERPPSHLEPFRDWNVDLIPKLLMANGALVKLLLYTGITKYLQFKSVEGSFVYKEGDIFKVPSCEAEALQTSLMGLAEKNRFRQLLSWAHSLDIANSDTWDGVDINETPMRKVYEKFGVDRNTTDLTGHAICLYLNDDYMERPAKETVQRMKLYSDSLAMYGKSPYLYPLYGLGELPQAFARLSAVYGGTYMLDKPDARVVYDDNGVVKGVEADGVTARAKIVVCDPSYAEGKTKKVGTVARAICLLTHPVPGTGDRMSAQIILPQNQLDRRHDIYVCAVSHEHRVTSAGKFIAIVSTVAETDNPREELQPGLKLLGDIERVFYRESELFEPVDAGVESKLFITSGYDATTHFETTCHDVLDVYERVVGEKFDFDAVQAKISEAEAAFCQ